MAYSGVFQPSSTGLQNTTTFFRVSYNSTRIRSWFFTPPYKPLNNLSGRMNVSTTPLLIQPASTPPGRGLPDTALTRPATPPPSRPAAPPHPARRPTPPGLPSHSATLSAPKRPPANCSSAAVHMRRAALRLLACWMTRRAGHCSLRMCVWGCKVMPNNNTFSPYPYQLSPNPPLFSPYPLPTFSTHPLFTNFLQSTSFLPPPPLLFFPTLFYHASTHTLTAPPTSLRGAG